MWNPNDDKRDCKIRLNKACRIKEILYKQTWNQKSFYTDLKFQSYYYFISIFIRFFWYCKQLSSPSSEACRPCQRLTVQIFCSNPDTPAIQTTASVREAVKKLQALNIFIYPDKSAFLQFFKRFCWIFSCFLVNLFISYLPFDQEWFFGIEGPSILRNGGYLRNYLLSANALLDIFHIYSWSTPQIIPGLRALFHIGLTSFTLTSWRH